MGRKRKFYQILGKVGFWSECQHFYKMFNLDCYKCWQLSALEYHVLFLKFEKRYRYTPTVVNQLKYVEIFYSYRWRRWEWAYDMWENHTYPKKHGKGRLTLEQIMTDRYVFKVYESSYYHDSSSQKLKFARNIYYHVNDHCHDDGLPSLSLICILLY